MSCVFGIGDIQLIVSLRMSVIPELTSGNSSVISVRDIGVNNTVSPSLTFAILVLQEDQLFRSGFGAGAAQLSLRSGLGAGAAQLSLKSGLGAGAAQLSLRFGLGAVTAHSVLDSSLRSGLDVVAVPLLLESRLGADAAHETASPSLELSKTAALATVHVGRARLTIFAVGAEFPSLVADLAFSGVASWPWCSIQCSRAHLLLSLSVISIARALRFCLIAFFEFFCTGGLYPGRKNTSWMSRSRYRFASPSLTEVDGPEGMVGVKTGALEDSVTLFLPWKWAEVSVVNICPPIYPHCTQHLLCTACADS